MIIHLCDAVFVSYWSLILALKWSPKRGDGASAIDLANRLDIDVILLDLNMKGMSGLDTLNALRRDGVTAQIIYLILSDASSDVFCS